MGNRVTKEVLYLRHNFTDAERLKMGDDLASAYNRQADIDAEEAVVKSQFKERRASVEQTIGALSRNLANQFEMRNIQCDIVYDEPNVGEVSYKRTDDGSVVKTRPMTEAERQLDLPLSSESGIVAVPADESKQNIVEFFNKNNEEVPEPEGTPETESEEESEEDEDSEEDQDDYDEEENLLDAKHDEEFAAVDAPKEGSKRGRGRPKGSKNSIPGFDKPTNASAIPDSF